MHFNSVTGMQAAAFKRANVKALLSSTITMGERTVALRQC
ncbi:hypothetical protein HP15_p187g136 (plasmid) [Marinobacter adhaerens HP15]|uniref:Uncharacterized protein n=1 Tax=Marinobacter adhaerens (strain DSM 23420 / HP15) TaxID=225937 RepID=E4PS98_MARAH|nr:hypothetical protein HP15_p187g136 [Marinobacter adhaerens HP15]